jgi:YD repeat-containing protein
MVSLRSCAIPLFLAVAIAQPGGASAQSFFIPTPVTHWCDISDVCAATAADAVMPALVAHASTLGVTWLFDGIVGCAAHDDSTPPAVICTGLYHDSESEDFLLHGAVAYPQCHREDDTSVEPPKQGCQREIAPTALVGDKNLGVLNYSASCSGAGECLNVGTGNKTLMETDYESPYPGGTGFIRFYNSQDGYGEALAGALSVLGTNWRHSWSAKINVYITSPATLVATRWDGRVVRFVRSGSAWVPEADAAETASDNGTGWILTSQNNERELYDAAGKLIARVDPSGRTSTVVYAGDSGVGLDGFYEDGARLPIDLPVRIVDFKGRVLTLRYARNPTRLSKLITPDQKVVEFTYSTFPGKLINLTGVGYPNGSASQVRTYLYNESSYTSSADRPYFLTGIVDENNYGTSTRFATFKYHADGRAMSSEHNLGALAVNRYAHSYGSGGAVSVTTPLETTGTHNYIHGVAAGVSVPSSFSRPCPGCSTSTATSTTLFDASTRNLDKSVDFLGNLTCYDTYVRNLETKRTEGLAGTSCTTKTTTPVTREIKTDWMTAWRLPKRIQEPLRVTTFAYHTELGVSCAPTGASSTLLCSKTIQATTDADGTASAPCSTPSSPTCDGAARTTSYTYDVSGQVVRVDGPRPDSDVYDRTDYAYYASSTADHRAGDLATVTNAKGHVVTFTHYDGAGRLLRSVDANGLETIFEYFDRGWIKARKIGTAAAGFETTAYAYDAVGQPKRITLPDGSYVKYDYDGAHRLVAMCDGDSLNSGLTSCGGPSPGNLIVYADHDGMGNWKVQTAKDPLGALARSQARAFDVLNRLQQEIGGTSPAQQIVQYKYDAHGNLEKTTDPFSRDTTNKYDALNRLIEVQDPFNASVPSKIAYAYNGQDKLAAITDPRLLTTTYSLNGHGESITLTSPDSGVTTHTYDEASNLKTKIDARGAVVSSTSYNYDALNRLVQITYPDETVTYTYDSCTNGIGHLCTAADKTGSTSYKYDLWGRITSKTHVITAAGTTTNHTLGYTYNTVGQLARITLPSGRQVDYGYSNNRPISVKVNGAIVLSAAEYEPFGPIRKWRWGNDTIGTPNIHVRQHDKDYRLTKIASTLPTNSSGSIFDSTVAWDKADRVESVTYAASSALNLTDAGYDALDRLVSIKQGATTWGYTYDGVGNRLTASTTGSTSTTLNYPSPLTSHRLQSLSGGVTRTFTYDNVGNVTSDGSNTWTFGGNNRPTQVTNAGTTTYAINAFGQRVRKANSGSATRFAYDLAGRLWGEFSDSGAPISETIWLGDLPVAVIR